MCCNGEYYANNLFLFLHASVFFPQFFRAKIKLKLNNYVSIKIQYFCTKYFLFLQQQIETMKGQYHTQFYTTLFKSINSILAQINLQTVISLTQQGDDLIQGATGSVSIQEIFF